MTYEAAKTLVGSVHNYLINNQIQVVGVGVGFLKKNEAIVIVYIEPFSNNGDTSLQDMLQKEFDTEEICVKFAAKAKPY